MPGISVVVSGAVGTVSVAVSGRTASTTVVAVVVAVYRVTLPKDVGSSTAMAVGVSDRSLSDRSRYHGHGESGNTADDEFSHSPFFLCFGACLPEWVGDVLKLVAVWAYSSPPAAALKIQQKWSQLTTLSTMHENIFRVIPLTRRPLMAAFRAVGLCGGSISAAGPLARLAAAPDFAWCGCWLPLSTLRRPSDFGRGHLPHAVARTRDHLACPELANSALCPSPGC